MAEEEGKLLCLRWELKGAAISEFEVARSADERRGWRAGAASGEGQRADLWPIPILGFFAAHFALILRPRSFGYLGLRPFTVYTHSLRPRLKAKLLQKPPATVLEYCGKNREARPGGKFRQKFYRREFPFS